MKQQKLVPIWRLFSNAFKKLGENDPLRLAGATAFFTTFALPPMVLILIQLLGLVMNNRELNREMFHAISNTVGMAGAEQVATAFTGIKSLAINWYISAAGFIFLLFVCTTLFKILKESVNQLWHIRNGSEKIKNELYARLKALAAIAVAAVLFIVGLIADALQSTFGHYIHDLASSQVAAYAIIILNKIISLTIASLWFTLILKYLADAVVSWRVAITGGILTGILFTAGKILLRLLLPYENINTVFGASGSFVLLLLFIFYSSFIFYYGVCFTRECAAYYGHKIKPRQHASEFTLKDI